ncbi:unnamed protein product [Gongylonema pulchrum]|uniref:Myosin motor domain-containing protein n=1 Tax=Gongylonema pulchrum TaxID=637853 RepID=A0A183DP97_9BILA|nr:unnamed protein product [Gongylonema pulchrum]
MIGNTMNFKQTAWKFGVIKYQSVHFLCVVKTPYKRSERDSITNYRGHKFEQYMTSGINETVCESASD